MTYSYNYNLLLNRRNSSPLVDRRALGQTSSKNVQQGKFRIVLYSHDSMGLGHVRRNILIAQVLSNSSFKPSILIVSGTTEAHKFRLPSGVDCLTLPSLYKELDGTYRSRRLRVSLKELITIRTNTIYSTISAFNPNLIIVDDTPRGAFRELDPTLERFSATAGTHCILGLRDIKDDASTVMQEWNKDDSLEAIRKYYDEIWIYGDSNVYNPVKEYNLPAEISAKTKYTGYLDQKIRLEQVNKKLLRKKHNKPFNQFALCLVGGGQDGDKLASAFVNAEFPDDLSGVLLLGPHINYESRHKLLHQVANNPKMKVIDFHPEPTMLLQNADYVVSMFGYNSAAEILSFNKQALIVPRVIPRKEQLIRAERLVKLGLIDMLHPDELSSQKITDWLVKMQNNPTSKYNHGIDMKGLIRIPEFVESLCSESIRKVKNHLLYEID